MVDIKEEGLIKMTQTIPEQFNDLEKASETSTDFWNNPVDDEIWNNA